MVVVTDRSGVRMVVVETSGRRLVAAVSTGVAVVPLLTESGAGLLTEAGDLFELEEAGTVPVSLPYRLSVAEYPPIPSAPR